MLAVVIHATCILQASYQTTGPARTRQGWRTGVPLDAQRATQSHFNNDRGQFEENRIFSRKTDNGVTLT